MSKASSKRPRPPLSNLPPSIDNQIPLIHPRGTDYIRGGYVGDGSGVSGYGGDGDGGSVSGYGGDGYGYGDRDGAGYSRGGKDGYGEGAYGGGEGREDGVRWRRGEGGMQERRGLKYQIDEDDDDSRV